jgi:MFS family permease
MAFQPSDSLRNRTFIGLIVAQFLAGFNDQAIHASAMFYAIHQGILTEAQAISLMPILFYAPWAIFCTLAGYLADRFSKRQALVIWKVAEVGVALVALAGFYLGTVHPEQFKALGVWMVMSTVFLMGTHAAFFAPAKYGAMPEILQPHVLSRGNGILESTTFLAAILGTVCGGLLSFFFRGQEYWIGVVLLVLALIGAVASLLIAYLPPANPERLFPKNLFKPLFDNLGVMFRSRPLILSMLGIAFFIFMVSYMRAAVYMHGQTRNPRWDEFHTSLVVATVALGVGLGAPLAGFLSGGKVELGLVPLGTLGMALSLLLSALTMHWEIALIVALVLIGFFSGFYMVPLYTLLQYRAPKTSKGDLIATSNFINVTGAIAASLLFYLLVFGSEISGITPLVEQNDNMASGTLRELKYNKHGRLAFVRIEVAPGFYTDFRAESEKQPDEFDLSIIDEPFGENLFEMVGSGLKKGDEVTVSSYKLKGELSPLHYRIRRADQPLKDVYDQEGLPSYLFIGAAMMVLGILSLLCRQLPDFFVRALFWLRSLGRFRIKVIGMHNLPPRGPVILATNCDRMDSSMQLVAATDRYTHYLLLEDKNNRPTLPVLRFMARRTGYLVLSEITPETIAAAVAMAKKALARDDLLAVTVDGHHPISGIENLVQELRRQFPVEVLPVFCGPLHAGQDSAERRLHGHKVRVVFGQPLPAETNFDDIRQQIRQLGDWVRRCEGDGDLQTTAKIPVVSDALRTATAPGRPPNP